MNVGLTPAIALPHLNSEIGRLKRRNVRIAVFTTIILTIVTVAVSVFSFLSGLSHLLFISNQSVPYFFGLCLVGGVSAPLINELSLEILDRWTVRPLRQFKEYILLLDSNTPLSNDLLIPLLNKCGNSLLDSMSLAQRLYVMKEKLK